MALSLGDAPTPVLGVAVGVTAATGVVGTSSSANWYDGPPVPSPFGSPQVSVFAPVLRRWQLLPLKNAFEPR